MMLEDFEFLYGWRLFWIVFSNSVSTNTKHKVDMILDVQLYKKNNLVYIILIKVNYYLEVKTNKYK